MRPAPLATFALVVLALTFGAAPEATAQNARAAMLIGQPLIYAKDGKLTGCGIRVMAMDEAPKSGATTLIIDSSIQLDLKVAGMLAKFVASRATQVDGAPVVRSRPVVERAWFRADALTPTNTKDAPLRLVATSIN